MKLLTCGQCGQRVFFENVSCGNCGMALGFSPDELEMVAFELPPAVEPPPAGQTAAPVIDGSTPAIDPSAPATNAGAPATGTIGTTSDAPAQGDSIVQPPVGAAPLLPPVWRRVGSDGPDLRPCQNYVGENVCNWMVAAGDPNPLCRSCRTTYVIPALGKGANRLYWFALEQAKRRLLYTLLTLGLPFPSKDEDAEHGLSFHFLEEVNPAERVLTGHDHGLITLNIAEADDAHREAMRTSMHEPYRTLVGHFRHESGHYYWDRLVDGSPWLDDCRALFGDDRLDYGEALKHHYENGPPADWAINFVSTYATSHPWEDWAECWAHYLHMVDGLETAAAWGLRLDAATPGGESVVPVPVGTDDESLAHALINQWLPVSQFVNGMTRSLGLHDGYPFQLPPAVVAKLEFIHKVVRAATRGEIAMRFGADAPPSTAEAPPADAQPVDAQPSDVEPANVQPTNVPPSNMQPANAQPSGAPQMAAAPPPEPGSLPVNPDSPATPLPDDPAPDEMPADEPPSGKPTPVSV